jgi:TnpA family transposase
MPVRFLSDAELARLSGWPTWREAVAVLDEIFGNPADLPIAEHTTDTAGQTLATFGIFSLAGLQFSPLIRDIGRLQLYRLGPGSAWRGRYPHAGTLLTQPIQTQLIADQWNDLFFAHQGHVRRRHLDDQVDRALCLTLVTNAAVLWTTTYLGDALDALRTDGFPVTDETAAHLTPAQHDHINFYGTYSFRRRDRTAPPGTPPATVTCRLTKAGRPKGPDSLRC